MKKNIEFMIMGIIAFFVLAGIELIYLGYWIGIVVAGIGLIAWAIGWKTYPTSPYTVGALTMWGDYIKTGHEPSGPGDKDTRETVCVKGKTVLAPFFPFYIDAVEIDMTAEEWVFDVTISSVEDADKDGNIRSVPVTGKIKLTVTPNDKHANSFVQSGGKLSKIKDLIQGIVFRETQRIVTHTRDGNGIPGLSFIEMAQQGDLISKTLEGNLNGGADTAGIFQEKSFGVLCKFVQVVFDIPDEIKKSMMSASKVKYDISARNQEFAADVKAAKMFMKLAGNDGQKAWDMAQASRLVRDEAVERIQVEGLGVPVGGLISSELIESKLRGKRRNNK